MTFKELAEKLRESGKADGKAYQLNWFGRHGALGPNRPNEKPSVDGDLYFSYYCKTPSEFIDKLRELVGADFIRREFCARTFREAVCDINGLFTGGFNCGHSWFKDGGRSYEVSFRRDVPQNAPIECRIAWADASGRDFLVTCRERVGATLASVFEAMWAVVQKGGAK